MELNKKLFNNFYEVVNIATDDLMDIVLADDENKACELCGGKNLSARHFFEDFEDGTRTIDDLRTALKESHIELKDILKTPEQLFNETFKDKYDSGFDTYELMLVRGANGGYKELLIMNYVYGACAVFNVSKDYNVFDLKVIDNFLTSTHSISKWYSFVKLMDEVKELIYEYEHPFEEDENENE